MFLKTSTPELVPLDEDAAVIATRETLYEARMELEAREAEEKQLIRLVSGKVAHATDDMIEDARRRLSIVKGTQDRWFMYEAQQVRDNVKILVGPYQAAVAAAKQRLIEAGEAKRKPLVQQLADTLRDAQVLAGEMEELCQVIGLGGVEKPQHPFPILLPGEIVDWQLDLAKKMGLCR